MTRTWGGIPLCLAAVVVLGGCSGSPSEGGSAGPERAQSADCVAALDYGGRHYLGYGDPVRVPELSGVTGTGTVPGCDEGRGAAEDEEVAVQELAGVDPADAVSSAGDIYVRWRDGAGPQEAASDLPAAVAALFEAVPCGTDGSFRLAGDWLEAPGAEDSPGDEAGPDPLLPPYRVVLRVDTAPAAYQGARVSVQVRDAIDPGLTHHDVATALWSGGRISATVHCDGPAFVAESLSATPPA